MPARPLWIAISLAPLGLTLASFFFGWRLLDGRAVWAGVGCYSLAGLVAALNFYLSFLREPIHRWRGRSADTFRYVSGVPLLGELAVVGLALLPASLLASVGTLALLLLNTGSMFWFGVAVALEPKGRPTKEKQ